MASHNLDLGGCGVIVFLPCIDHESIENLGCVQYPGPRNLRVGFDSTSLYDNKIILHIWCHMHGMAVSDCMRRLGMKHTDKSTKKRQIMQ